MDFLEHIGDLPIYISFFVVIAMRVIDVSFGTVRTISVVQGRMKLSVCLGFCEVLVWLFTVSHVLAAVNKQPLLMPAYAAGFATGNAVGMFIEKKLALGMSVIRMISCGFGEQIADAIRDLGQAVTVFEGSGRNGPRQMLYIVCRRRDEQEFIAIAQKIEPDIMHAIESATAARITQALPHHSGWRTPLKK